MKILIATDIHGSAYYAAKVVEKFKQHKAEQVILLGDIYNHGPRNPFPRDYAPVRVAESLNSIANKIISVRGNCDSEVDQTISAFPFVPQYMLTLKDRRLYFTHGHTQNKGNFPMSAMIGDVVFCGHFHISEIASVDGIICVNVGSASMPRDGKNAYCILDDKSIVLYDFDDNVIAQQKI